MLLNKSKRVFAILVLTVLMSAFFITSCTDGDADAKKNNTETQKKDTGNGKPVDPTVPGNK